MIRYTPKPPLLFAFAASLLLSLALAFGAQAAVASNPVAAAAAGAPGDEWALPLAPAQDDGAAVYDQHCASCHQPGGVGVPGSFPPLTGNPNAAEPAYVEQVIVNGLSGPIEVDGVAYDAVMPAIDLGDGERAALVDYVVGLASTTPSTTAEPSSPVEPTVGDAARGRRLFTGATGFENDGAACASCHEAGDVGHLGGGSLGPDLDTSFATFGGEAGLSAWLANPASATMQPIFTAKPLTEPEIADLVAFLETAPDRERPRAYGDALLLGGLAGLAVLLVGMALARRTMSPTYAQRLRSKR